VDTTLEDISLKLAETRGRRWISDTQLTMKDWVNGHMLGAAVNVARINIVMSTYRVNNLSHHHYATNARTLASAIHFLAFCVADEMG